MTRDLLVARTGRRGFLAGSAVVGLLAVPGAAGAAMRGRRDADGREAVAIRELLRASSRNAFRTLSPADGFWASTVSRISLPSLFTQPGPGYRGVLRQQAFRDNLHHRLNVVAAAAVPRIAPLVQRSIDRLQVRDPAMVLRSGPTGATTALRGAMGPRLINALIPALTRALKEARDPVIIRAIVGLKGVNLGDVAHALANATDNAIWYQIGAEEAAIRRDPRHGGSVTLGAALRAG